MKFMGIIIATNMVSLDENIRNGSLSGSEIKINYKKINYKMSPKKGGNVYFQAKNPHHPCNWKKNPYNAYNFRAKK